MVPTWQKNRVFLVTHPAKAEGPDPYLTDEGREQILEVVLHQLPTPRLVACGTARRHIDTANTLGVLEEVAWYDPMIGDPSSGVPNGSGGWHIALACGTSTSLDRFRMPSARATLIHLAETYGECEAPGNTVLLIGGRPLLEALKAPAASGALYEIFSNGSAVRLA